MSYYGWEGGGLCIVFIFLKVRGEGIGAGWDLCVGKFNVFICLRTMEIDYRFMLSYSHDLFKCE